MIQRAIDRAPDPPTPFPYQACFDKFLHQMTSGIACFWDRPRMAGSSRETHCRVASTPLVHWGPSQNHSFSQWFSTFSKRSQCCVQLMIKSVTHCFAKSREGSEDCGRGPYRGNVHFHKVFKGFWPIGPAAMLLVQRCILVTVAASGIPRATPRKHKDFQRF